LVGGKAREDLIVANWPDIFRCAATMTAGKIRPSQLLRQLASYPRQNNLAVALREVGRIERTLFIIEWILDTDMQRRAQIGLNKERPTMRSKMRSVSGGRGNSRSHDRGAALPNRWAQFIDCGDHYWNTVHLGHAVTERRNEGLDVPPEFLPHISPLGWAHILLTGEYLWPKEPKA
jgi:TnpA family transposase